MNSVGGILRHHLENFVDLVYPRSCAHCGDAVEEREPFPHLCEPCVRRIHWVHSPACPVCGYPFFGRMEADRQCPHCCQLRPVFGAGRTAVLLKGPARELIHGLKYRGEFHLLRDIQAVLSRADEVLEFIAGAVLVPVPLHSRKRRERGFNQSRLLADLFLSTSRAAGIRELLLRAVDTETQTLFDRAERRKNLKNAFAIHPDLSLSKRQRYVLVDDVFTTGSTLNSCAAVLRRAGARRVDVVTFGHG